MRLRALESLRGLAEERLGSVCVEEVSAAAAAVEYMGPSDGRGNDEREAACMAAYVLGIRNGGAVCGLDSALYAAFFPLAMGTSASLMEPSAEVRLMCALQACMNLLVVEATSCVTASVGNAACEKLKQDGIFGRGWIGRLGQLALSERAYALAPDFVRLFKDESISLACGAAGFVGSQAGVAGVDCYIQFGCLGTALEELQRRVAPSWLPVEWWIRSTKAVDSTAVRLFGSWVPLVIPKRMSSPREASCWRFAVDETIHVVKMHFAARMADAVSWVCDLPACVSLPITNHTAGGTVRV